MSKQQISWNTVPVMKRYRELKAGGVGGLEASRMVLKEAEARVRDVSEGL